MSILGVVGGALGSFMLLMFDNASFSMMNYSCGNPIVCRVRCDTNISLQIMHGCIVYRVSLCKEVLTYVMVLILVKIQIFPVRNIR